MLALAAASDVGVTSDEDEADDAVDELDGLCDRDVSLVATEPVTPDDDDDESRSSSARN